MKLILLLPLRLEMHSIFKHFFVFPSSFASLTQLMSCYAKMHISTIYLLLLPLVHRTIKYIKIIVFRLYNARSHTIYFFHQAEGFTLVKKKFFHFILLASRMCVYVHLTTLRREMQFAQSFQTNYGVMEGSTGGPCV